MTAARCWKAVSSIAGKFYHWISGRAKKLYRWLFTRVEQLYRWLLKKEERLWQWFKRYGTKTFISTDCIVGLLVAAGLFVGGLFNHAITPGTGVLIGEIAIGTAILSVALIALSVLVAFLGPEYVKLLTESVGMDEVIMPYQTVAVVSAIDILVAILSILVWPIAPYWAKTLTASVAAGLTTWAVIGTVQLVNITARHGRRRARMPEITGAAKEALQDRSKAS